MEDGRVLTSPTTYINYLRTYKLPTFYSFQNSVVCDMTTLLANINTSRIFIQITTRLLSVVDYAVVV